MARFEIHYSFTCKKCGKSNAMQTATVNGNNEVEARDRAYSQAKCSKCGAVLESGQPLTATVKRLD
jgi:transcription elongation factor Elf1